MFWGDPQSGAALVASSEPPVQSVSVIAGGPVPALPQSQGGSLEGPSSNGGAPRASVGTGASLYKGGPLGLRTMMNAVCGGEKLGFVELVLEFVSEGPELCVSLKQPVTD